MEPAVTISISAGEAARSMLEKGSDQEAKSEVSYRPADSRTESCGKCAHGTFAGSHSTGTCQIVAGKIEDSMVCDRFESDTAPSDDDAATGSSTEPDHGEPA